MCNHTTINIKNMRFTETLTPIEVREKNSLSEILGSLGRAALPMQFEYVPARHDEIIDELNRDISSRQITVEELESRPDTEELNRFLDAALEDFRKDGIDYASDE